MEICCFLFFKKFFPNMGRRDLFMSIDVEMAEKNTREKQRPGEDWRQWDKMEGSPSKGEYLNLRDKGKDTPASFSKCFFFNLF